jgi:DNA polymerase elongation subunit (family B)
LSYTDAYFDRDNDKIYVAERIKGIRRFYTTDVKYVFYYPDPKGKYTSIFGEKLTKVECKSKKEFNKEKRIHSSKLLYESDINPLFRFLEENYTNADVPQLNIGFFDLEVDFNKKLGFAPPDDPFNPITAVALHLTQNSETICLAVKPKTLSTSDASKIMSKFPNSYLMEDEKELLLTFIELIQDIDVFSGWNSTGFDIPYLINRITRVLGREYNKQLCLWEKYPVRREYEMYGKTNETYDLIGRQHLDYLELYRKYTYHEMHSYSLDAISEYELNETKISYEGTLDQLYNNDFEKFIDYNRQDVELLVKLDKKLQFIDLANVIAHDNCVILPTTMGSVAQIDQAIVNEAHKRGFIVPDRKRKNDFKKKQTVEIDEFEYDDRKIYVYDEDEEPSSLNENDSVAGAYVADPKKGIQHWVGSIDLNSLYPSILRALNMSPETIVGQIRLELTSQMLSKFDKISEAWDGKFATREYELVMEKNRDIRLKLDFEDGNIIEATGAEIYDIIFSGNTPWMLTSNGTIFTTEKMGIIPGLLERWYKERKEIQAKAKEFKSIENGIKVSEEMSIELRNLL